MGNFNPLQNQDFNENNKASAITDLVCLFVSLTSLSWILNDFSQNFSQNICSTEKNMKSEIDKQTRVVC